MKDQLELFYTFTRKELRMRDVSSMIIGGFITFTISMIIFYAATFIKL
jgi:hypothetical protein